MLTLWGAEAMKLLEHCQGDKKNQDEEMNQLEKLQGEIRT